MSEIKMTIGGLPLSGLPTAVTHDLVEALSKHYHVSHVEYMVDHVITITLNDIPRCKACGEKYPLKEGANHERVL